MFRKILIPVDLRHAERLERAPQAAAGPDRAGADRRSRVAEADMVDRNGPTVELDKALSDTVETLGADLVVMATHRPDVTDCVWASHSSHARR